VAIISSTGSLSTTASRSPAGGLRGRSGRESRQGFHLTHPVWGEVEAVASFGGDLLGTRRSSPAGIPSPPVLEWTARSPDRWGEERAGRPPSAEEQRRQPRPGPSLRRALSSTQGATRARTALSSRGGASCTQEVSSPRGASSSPSQTGWVKRNRCSRAPYALSFTSPAEGAPRTTKSRPKAAQNSSYEEPAATYSPRGLPPKYHRR
jgi:hypothetical protein